MRPSDKRRLFILQYLSERNHDSHKSVLINLFSEGQKLGYASEKLEESFESMDNHHDYLLNIEMMSVIGMPNPIERVVLLGHSWLTQDGEDYLYELQNPEEGGSTLQMSTFNIENLNNNGQAAFGDHASLSDNHSTNVDIDNSIHQLIELKSELPNSVDPQRLDELAKLLKQMIAGQVKPEPGALKKFGNFLDKTWKIISPVAAPLIVEAFKPIIF
ncbi:MULTISPECIES: hypothetical protein [Lentilactobacillus]|uniref:Uncharacterized protein n=1 Tax=Lentilactobacillus parabuchneri TaxID=152331 RepID=A0A1X1FD87_9LACO|nr:MULTISPECIES: hypothetical protein [Lentilactobacillus]MQM78834.1 hypothetical protein [Lentilactobacillus buchneri]MQM88888.1 hypothetical protein [Lentilactobacillus buchneri]MQN21037.1 hypothetical protein [Lentilactobacillus buchneri]MSE19770.1 hypothetical protein [Lentilactobacillus parabuchneri]ORN03145.1 hypothetical protein FAM21829_01773 [Lentilactobacillus parabuchneri]